MTATALSLLSAPDIEPWLVAMGLGAARTVPIAWWIPAFGGTNAPATVRLGLGLAMAALCLPQIIGHVPADAGPVAWLVLLCREVAVGTTVGFVGACFFRGVEAAGRLTDITRGANMAEVLSPVSEGRSSPLGDVWLLLACVLFLELGGVGHVARALGRSYEALPIGVATLGAMRAAPLLSLVGAASGGVLSAALGLAAPALVALLLADVALGVVARAAPQVPIYFVGMPVKALLGVGMVLLGFGALQAALVAGLRGWGAMLDQAFVLWR